MSLWQIAAKNVWQNRGRYVAYLVSAGIAVMIYFLYAALIHHPQLQGGFPGAGYIAAGLRAAAVVIALFTFLFLLYSNAAFVRSRMKEFGLLSLFGVTKGQLVRIVLGEGIIIAGVALTAGLGCGLLFLRLFFMAISAVLQLPAPIAFYAGPAVWLETVLLFSAFFWIVSLASLRSVLRRNIVELVRAGRQPKAQPTFSRWKTALGLCLLLGGYAWASAPNAGLIIIGIIPVTTMVSFGTYLLMREGSIALLSWLHKRERFFYRPGPFLQVSQLVYKMQDNFRVLSAVTLLVAVILTAVGTAYTGFVLMTGDAIATSPHVIQLVQPATADPAPGRRLMADVLERHGVEGLTHQEITTRLATLDGDNKQVLLLPYSVYRGASRSGAPLPQGDVHNAILVSPASTPMAAGAPQASADDHVSMGGQKLAVHVRHDYGGPAINTAYDYIPVLVLPDSTFDTLAAQIPAAEQLHMTFWSGEAWKTKQIAGAMAELRTLGPLQMEGVHLDSRVERYRDAVSLMGLVLFIGVFVSLVFFAACCSLLYFRLFTEIEEDRRYFRQLRRVGLNPGELKRLALGQAAVIFLVPFLLGLVHSTFAMHALGSMTNRTVLQYGWGVAVAYLPLYGACFVGAASLYWRSLQAGLPEEAVAA